MIFEVVTLDSDSKVHETVCKLAPEFPEFLAVDEFVYARNFFDMRAVFRTWNTNLNEWSVLLATVNPVGLHPF